MLTFARITPREIKEKGGKLSYNMNKDLKVY